MNMSSFEKKSCPNSPDSYNNIKNYNQLINIKSGTKLDFNTSPYLKELKHESFSQKLIRELTKEKMEHCIEILRNIQHDLNKLQYFSQEDFLKSQLSEIDQNKIIKITTELRENEDYIQLLHDINTFKNQENTMGNLCYLMN